MSTERERLRTLINEHFLPMLKMSGFCGPEELKGNSRLYEFVSHSDEGDRTFNINFEKYGEGMFCVDMYVELTDKYPHTSDGQRHFITGKVYRKSLFGKKLWFKAKAPILFRITGNTNIDYAEKEVKELCGIYPEIEAWWNSLTDSEHIATDKVQYGSHSNKT